MFLVLGAVATTSVVIGMGLIRIRAGSVVGWAAAGSG
jgi:hypothetical protein